MMIEHEQQPPPPLPESSSFERFESSKIPPLTILIIIRIDKYKLSKNSEFVKF